METEKRKKKKGMETASTDKAVELSDSERGDRTASQSLRVLLTAVPASLDFEFNTFGYL